VTGADGHSFILRERHPVPGVHHESNAGRFAGVFDVVRLVDIDDHLKTYVQQTSSVVQFSKPRLYYAIACSVRSL